MEYFVISAKFVPLKYYTLSSQLRRLTSFSVGLFGSANSVTLELPGNAKIVYIAKAELLVPRGDEYSWWVKLICDKCWHVINHVTRLLGLHNITMIYKI